MLGGDQPKQRSGPRSPRDFGQFYYNAIFRRSSMYCSVEDVWEEGTMYKESNIGVCEIKNTAYAPINHMDRFLLVLELTHGEHCYF